MDKYKFTNHALEEILRRGIKRDFVDLTLKEPDSINESYGGRKCYQKVIKYDDKSYLVRVVVEFKDNEFLIITVYRTSKIGKYISKELT